MQHPMQVYEAAIPQVDALGQEIYRFAVRVAEIYDQKVMDAILEAARAEGITHLQVIDKEFMLSAIRHEMERRGIGVEGEAEK